MNPVKRYRKEVLRLTIDSLCNQAEVSKTLVIKNEQGAYPVPSETLVEFFRNRVPNFDKEAFYEEYRLFQHEQRVASYGLLLTIFPIKLYLLGLPVGYQIKDNEPYYHPFEFWRLHSHTSPNLTKISKAFCVHQGLLHKFENETHLVNSVPKPLRDALIESGYEASSLDNLDFAYLEYKRYLRNLNTRVGKVINDRERNITRNGA